MIVVAIIGILAAVAIPSYKDYVARSKWAAALAEVAPAKVGYDVAVQDGLTPVIPAAGASAAAGEESVGVQASNTNTDIALDAAAGTITATIKNGPPDVAGKTIIWTRDATTGAWTCATTALQKYVGAVAICTGT